MPPSRTRAPRRAFIAWMLVALTSALGCDRESAHAPDRFESDAVPEVVVTEVRAEGWTTTLALYGTVEAATEVELTAPLSAKVETVAVTEGATVEAGSVLVEFDASDSKTRLNQARSSSASARSELEQARSDLDKAKALFRKGVAPYIDVESAEATVRAARERYEDSRSSVSLASSEISDTKLVSPVGGRITFRKVEAGETVSAGTKLLTVSTTEQLRVRAWLSERHINELSIGTPVEVRVVGAPGRVFEGRVEFIGLAADPQTGNFELRVALGDAGDRVRPGMTASVQLPLEPQSDVVVLPREAVVDRAGTRLVFVAEGDSVRAVEPVLGVGDDRRVPVLEGIEPGQRVVLEGLEALRDGTAVSVRRTVPALPSPEAGSLEETE